MTIVLVHVVRLIQLCGRIYGHENYRLFIFVFTALSVRRQTMLKIACLFFCYWLVGIVSGSITKQPSFPIPFIVFTSIVLLLIHTSKTIVPRQIASSVKYVSFCLYAWLILANTGGYGKTNSESRQCFKKAGYLFLDSHWMVASHNDI